MPVLSTPPVIYFVIHFMIHFMIYGVLGWAAEIVWTASYELVSGTRKDPRDPRVRVAMTRPERWRLTGHTYLWMFPVYGLCGLAFEPCHALVRGAPWPARGLLWTALCFAVEYSVGWGLRRATGRCPWDYSYARWNVHGLIRLDYAPVWCCLGLALERLHDLLGPMLAGAQ